MSHVSRWLFALAGACACACAPAIAGSARDDVNYAALYAQGVTFADFLDQVRARRDEWRQHYNDATVQPELVTRMRALPARRRVLAVAAANCLDSATTV